MPNRIYIAIVVICILFTTSCQRIPSKIVPYNEMDIALINQAEKIYFELFKSCQQDSLDQFLSHSFITPKIYKSIHNKGQNDICQKIETELGEITSIDLIEAIYFKSLQLILRCKLNATKLSRPIEFRMVLTIENDLSAIAFYDWSAIYDYRTPKISWKEE